MATVCNNHSVGRNNHCNLYKICPISLYSFKLPIYGTWLPEWSLLCNLQKNGIQIVVIGRNSLCFILHCSVLSGCCNFCNNHFLIQLIGFKIFAKWRLMPDLSIPNNSAMAFCVSHIVSSFIKALTVTVSSSNISFILLCHIYIINYPIMLL